MSVQSKKVLRIQTTASRPTARLGWIPVGLVALSVVGCFDTGGGPPAVPQVPSPRPAVAAEGSTLSATPTAPSEPKKVAWGVAETPESSLRSDRQAAGRASPTIEVASDGPRRAVSAEPVPELRPASLIGAGRGDLRGRLGTPALLRREPSAEFWQFSGEGCVLHVYLHEISASADYRVTHVELLPRSGLDEVPSGCFERLLLGRREAG